MMAICLHAYPQHTPPFQWHACCSIPSHVQTLCYYVSLDAISHRYRHMHVQAYRILDIGYNHNAQSIIM